MTILVPSASTSFSAACQVQIAQNLLEVGRCGEVLCKHRHRSPNDSESFMPSVECLMRASRTATYSDPSQGNQLPTARLSKRPS